LLQPLQPLPRFPSGYQPSIDTQYEVQQCCTAIRSGDTAQYPSLGLSNAQAQVNPCASHVCSNVTVQPPLLAAPHHTSQLAGTSVPPWSLNCHGDPNPQRPLIALFGQPGPRRTHFCKHFAAQLANPQRRVQGSQDNCVSETGAAACASFSMTVSLQGSSAAVPLRCMSVGNGHANTLLSHFSHLSSSLLHVFVPMHVESTSVGVARDTDTPPWRRKWSPAQPGRC
jgi:hypothetical protein